LCFALVIVGTLSKLVFLETLLAITCEASDCVLTIDRFGAHDVWALVRVSTLVRIDTFIFVSVQFEAVKAAARVTSVTIHAVTEIANVGVS
jgi:hypothetical protein